ncbi:MAG: hypothetical protein ABSF69_26450 [Polyangiaceae bacterium]|jgi:hypothetical protein
MPTSFRSSLDTLASSFADSVLAAIRGASLDELLAEGAGGRGPRRPNGASATPTDGRGATSGRLPRRSDEDIAAALDKVVALVKKNKNGLRAEQIRGELKMQAKEMPRILKEGLSTKNLKAKGQKRATTYTAA